MDIKTANTLLVKKELESLYNTITGLNEYEDSSIIHLGFINYLVLLTLEISDYASKFYKQKTEYALRSQLKSCRARLKEYNSSANDILKNAEKQNKEQLMYYSTHTSILKKTVFKNLIKNIGVYKYNNRIISNTFLIEKDLRPIIYKNNKRDSQRIMKAGIEVGRLLNTLLQIFCISPTPSTRINLNHRIASEDYNVTKKNGLLISNDISITLFLLDILSIINFCLEIIDSFDICSELKYRIFYIAFFRTYHNMNNVLKYVGNYTHLERILNNYEYLDNSFFRNSMFHYDITDKLEQYEVNINEMYYGIISKYLKTTDYTFKKDLTDYLVTVSTEISSLILKNKKRNQ